MAPESIIKKKKDSIIGVKFKSIHSHFQVRMRCFYSKRWKMGHALYHFTLLIAEHSLRFISIYFSSLRKCLWDLNEVRSEMMRCHAESRASIIHCK